jgi:biopolymer transport protein ExbD
MAFRPSQRRSSSSEEVDPNIFPMMNLMVVLIPLLLSTASAIKLGMIELNLPQAAGGPIARAEVPKEATRSLDLTVSISDSGYYISTSMAILRGEDDRGPAIGLAADGGHDYEELSERLYEIKRRIRGSPNDTNKIIIQAEPYIDYQTLISTMDASRSFVIDDSEYELFPEVTLSAGVL